MTNSANIDFPEFIEIEFDIDDHTIHELAANILFSQSSTSIVLKQEPYSYFVNGGTGGLLDYRKGKGPWIWIAYWTFYGACLSVTYRKPHWLGPVYSALFEKMNFVSVKFGQYTITVSNKDGHTISHETFRLTPPGALRQVLTTRFGFSEQWLENFKFKYGLI